MMYDVWMMVWMVDGDFNAQCNAEASVRMDCALCAWMEQPSSLFVGARGRERLNGTARDEKLAAGRLLLVAGRADLVVCAPHAPPMLPCNNAHTTSQSSISHIHSTARNRNQFLV
jgi:hypothetical protein